MDAENRWLDGPAFIGWLDGRVGLVERKPGGRVHVGCMRTRGLSETAARALNRWRHGGQVDTFLGRAFDEVMDHFGVDRWEIPEEMWVARRHCGQVSQTVKSRVVRRILDGGSPSRVARDEGVSVSTVRHWLRKLE